MNKPIETYRTFLIDNQLEFNASYLIAVSGGCDSMVCLHIAQQLNLNISVAHVNYGLRGEESDQETSMVEKYCKKEKLSFYPYYENAQDYANNNKLTIQEAAREIRYAFFYKLIKSHHFSYVVTAHHSQDNIETFFLHAIRGSGIKGLSGIPAIRKQFIRPLLTLNKEDLIRYATKFKIPYKEDSSNLSNKYDRNFIRNKVLPSLKGRFRNMNEGIKTSISLINDDYTLLCELIDQKISPHTEKNNDILIIYPDKSIPELAWYHYLKKYGFNFTQIMDLVQKQHQSGKRFFSSSHTLFIDRDKWILELKKDNDNHIYFLDYNKSIDLPIKLSCTKIQIPEKLKSPKNIAYFDFKKLEFPLKLRKWLPGDEFIPFGMKGNKKISDYLIDNKIPLNEKENIWLLLSKNEIIWIIDHRINDYFSISEKSKFCYKIDTN